MSVNRNYAAKVMTLEKQLQDEKRRRIVAEPAPVAPKQYEGYDLNSVK